MQKKKTTKKRTIVCLQQMQYYCSPKLSHKQQAIDSENLYAALKFNTWSEYILEFSH